MTKTEDLKERTIKSLNNNIETLKDGFIERKYVGDDTHYYSGMAKGFQACINLIEQHYKEVSKTEDSWHDN